MMWDKGLELVVDYSRGVHEEGRVVLELRRRSAFFQAAFLPDEAEALANELREAAQKSRTPLLSRS